MTLLIKWLFGDNSSKNRDEQDEDFAVASAKRAKKLAEEDHEEVMELIQLLEIENRKNHYAQLVESALRAKKRAESS